jgi:hypothetical protein
MPHDFADLIAELDAAKAHLARRVKRTRTLISDRRTPTPTAETEADNSVFNWVERPDR